MKKHCSVAKEHDYQVVIGLFKISNTCIRILTQGNVPDHFIESIFFESTTSSISIVIDKKNIIYLKKISNYEWHLLGDIDFWNEENSIIGRCHAMSLLCLRSGIYAFSASELRSFCIDLLSYKIEQEFLYESGDDNWDYYGVCAPKFNWSRRLYEAYRNLPKDFKENSIDVFISHHIADHLTDNFDMDKVEGEWINEMLEIYEKANFSLDISYEATQKSCSNVTYY